MSNTAITSNVFPYQRPSFALPSQTDKSWARDARTGVDFDKLFESIWTNSSDALRVTNSKGMIIAVNDTFCRLVGMQVEELVGKPLTITYDSSVDPSTLLAEYHTRFNEGKISPVTSKRVRLQGGKEIYAETSNSFIKGGDGGTFVLTAIRDVSERHASEEALKESERKYHELVNNATQGIFQSSVHGKLITANDALIKMLGYDSFDELASRNLAEVYVNPEKREALSIMLLEKGVCSNIELSLRRKDGTVITVLEHSRAVKDESSNVVTFEGILEDNTERRRAEKELQVSEARYRMLFEASADGILIADHETKTFKDANPAMCRLLGYTREELRTLGLADIHPKQDLQRVIAEFEAQARGDKTLALDIPCLRKDGRILYADISTAKITIDDRPYNMGLFRDITERKRAEETLQHERNLLRILIDNLPDLIYFKDAAGRYVLNNRAHLRSIGVDHQENAFGKTTFDFHPPELAKQYRDDEMRIVQTGEPLLGKEELALHKDTGEQRWHLTSKIPLMNAEGAVTGIVGISRDITEHKELETRVQDSLTALQASRESLAQLNAQKDRLFSVLSHDLRSPFTSILGFCEILISDGETLTDAERSEFLTYIRDAAQRQLALLNKLLDWSRLQTGRIKLDIQEIDLGDLVISCIENHLGTSKQKEITLRSTLPSGIKIRGDKELLMQAFNNLISNALKFTAANGMISVDVIEDKEEEWVVAVKDTGRGIPKEDIGKLFKADEKYTRPGLQGEQGTGLGLSLVHEIMKQHSGSVSVESEVGQGTTFILRLQRLIEKKENVMMIVDDDEGVRVLHSRYLKSMYPDAQVIAASNGKEAFELAKKCRPRLIVTDYSMPEMNGYELLGLLKQEPTTKHIPVFVITGKGSTASTDTLLFSGAAAVLDKPTPRKVLQETIERVLAEKI